MSMETDDALTEMRDGKCVWVYYHGWADMDAYFRITCDDRLFFDEKPNACPFCGREIEVQK